MINYEMLIPENGYVIAELACGHEGSVSKFKELVDCAEKAGAKIIKTPIFIPRERKNENDSDWKLINKHCLVKKDLLRCVDYVKAKGLTFFADIYEYAGFRIAKELEIDGYKIQAQDLVNAQFVETVTKENKITILEIGGIHRSELIKILEFLKEKNLNKRIILIPGLQNVCTPLELHSLSEFADLILKYSSKYGIKVGCADHIEGNSEDAVIFPLMCLSQGACIIEKHITVDRKRKWQDYESALNSDQFESFIRKINRYTPLLKQIGFHNKEEIDNRLQFNRFALTNKDLKTGEIISCEDFNFERMTGKGMPLSSIDIHGSILKCDVKKGTILRRNLLKNNIGCIILARSSSSRLPNKALLKIKGVESIGLLMKRMKKCQRIDKFILATSIENSDDKLADIAQKYEYDVFRGSLEDVSDRLFEAAKYYDVNHIVRVTGDDILRDETMIEKVIDEHLSYSNDVTLTKNMPYGTDTEMFTFETIKTIKNNAIFPENTSYLEWYLQNNRYFSIRYVDSGYNFDPKLRITLDYPEDLLFFEKIFHEFNVTDCSFTIPDVLKFLHKNPEIQLINNYLSPKSKEKKDNLMLNYDRGKLIDTRLNI